MSTDDDHRIFLTTEQLPEPLRGMFLLLETQADHPARAWFDRIGNGVFADDATRLPAPWPIFRFRRGGAVAYVWEQGGVWRVRPWIKLGCGGGAAVRSTDSFCGALDLLLRRRPWWRSWQ
jgi:hypothetical protein